MLRHVLIQTQIPMAEIGVIGLGDTGGSIAHHLVEGGHDVIHVRTWPLSNVR